MDADTNGDKYVDKAEWDADFDYRKKSKPELTREEHEAIFQDMDLNKDGRLNKEEILEWAEKA